MCQIRLTTDLIPSKTGESDDTVLIDERSGEGAHAAIQYVYSTVKNDAEALADFSLSSYAAEIKKPFTNLNLAKLKVCPYAMRHGGASTDSLRHGTSRSFLHGRSLQEIKKKRGRWKSMASVRRYEKSGVLLKQWTPVPASIKKRAHKAEPEFIGRFG